MKSNWEYQLYQIAEEQAGYFSLSQARELGLQRSQIYRGVKRGKFERARTGVYRFVQFPSSRFEQIHAAALSAGENAVVGFQTALYIYELSDIIPDEIHLILPRTSSRRREGIRVHSTKLAPEEITLREGLRITTVARTIADCANIYVDDRQIKLAVRQALERGMATVAQFQAQIQRYPSRVRDLFQEGIHEVSP